MQTPVTMVAEVSGQGSLEHTGQQVVEWPQTSHWACLGPLSVSGNATPNDCQGHFGLRNSMTGVMPMIIINKNNSSNVSNTSYILVVVATPLAVSVPFHPHTNLVLKKVLFSAPFHMWEGWDSGKLIDRFLVFESMFFTAALYCKFNSSLCSTY